MEDRLCVAVVDDHARLVGTLRAATRSSRIRVLGPYEVRDRLLREGADVVVVDLDRDDGHGLATLVRVCETLHDVRVVGATSERDTELGSAVVTAGACGLLLATSEIAEIQDALRRAVAGELVLPDEHLTSLVDRLRLAREGQVEAGSIASLTARELQ